MTTIEDDGTFITTVLNETFLTHKVFEDLTTPQVTTSNGKHFGLGFEIYHFTDGNIALSHGGSDKGVQAIVFYLPKTKMGY